jgi:hypothetical protein
VKGSLLILNIIYITLYYILCYYTTLYVYIIINIFKFVCVKEMAINLISLIVDLEDGA